MKTNILTTTPLMFLNLENKNNLILLHTKNPKLNDNFFFWYSCQNATWEWKYYTKSNTDIAKMTFGMSIAVSETN